MPSGIRSERLVLRAVTLRQEIDFARQDSLTCNRVYTKTQTWMRSLTGHRPVAKLSFCRGPYPAKCNFASVRPSFGLRPQLVPLGVFDRLTPAIWLRGVRITQF
jgi:hypothetical protein